MENGSEVAHLGARVDCPTPCLTSITVRLRPGRDEQLAHKLREICQEGKHLLPGTTARYIARNQTHPEEIQIVLIWESQVKARERGRSLRRFFADLDDILDWGTASGRDYTVLLTPSRVPGMG